MTAREMFQQEKDLCRQWAAIAHSDMFQRILLYVRSDLMSRELSPEASKGALLFQQALETLADADDTLPSIPSVGLEHDLESDLKPRAPEFTKATPEIVQAPVKKPRTKK